MNPNPPNGPQHRPMLATQGNLDSIKKQFAAQQGNDIVITSPAGIVSANADGSPKTEQATAPTVPADQIQFFPFPDSGNIVAWVASKKPGDYLLVVNIEPDPAQHPRPSVIALCRQPEAAQMLCDGVNFLFKVQRETEAAQAASQTPQQ